MVFFMEEKDTKLKEINRERFSSIFKKDFAIFMIKPDGLVDHDVKTPDGEVVNINRNFLFNSFKNKINEYSPKIDSVTIDKMSEDMYAKYKPTKTKDNQLSVYHVNHKHEFFLVYFDSKQSQDKLDSVISEIYNYKKEIRKKYSKQERERDNGEKTSVETLVHSPESTFELIANLATFAPDRFGEFIDTSKMNLIEELKNQECQQKLAEYKAKGKPQKILDMVVQQYDSFFNTIKTTVLSIESERENGKAHEGQSYALPTGKAFQDLVICKSVDNKEIKQKKNEIKSLDNIAQNNGKVLG